MITQDILWGMIQRTQTLDDGWDQWALDLGIMKVQLTKGLKTWHGPCFNVMLLLRWFGQREAIVQCHWHQGGIAQQWENGESFVPKPWFRIRSLEVVTVQKRGDEWCEHSWVCYCPYLN